MKKADKISLHITLVLAVLMLLHGCYHLLTCSCNTLTEYGSSVLLNFAATPFMEELDGTIFSGSVMLFVSPG